MCCILYCVFPFVGLSWRLQRYVLRWQMWCCFQEIGWMYTCMPRRCHSYGYVIYVPHASYLICFLERNTILRVKIVKPGVMYRDIGKPISRIAKKNKFSVVKSYCGHGIGTFRLLFVSWFSMIVHWHRTCTQVRCSTARRTFRTTRTTKAWALCAKATCSPSSLW